MRAISQLLSRDAEERLTAQGRISPVGSGYGEPFCHDPWVWLRTTSSAFSRCTTVLLDGCGQGSAAQNAVRAEAEYSHRIPDNIASLPCVAILDSGVPAGHKYLRPYRRGHSSRRKLWARRRTRIEGRISHRLRRTGFPRGFWVDCLTSQDHVPSSMFRFRWVRPDSMTRASWMRYVVLQVPIRMYGCSIAALRLTNRWKACSAVERRERLLLVQDLDNFIFANDCVVIMAAGNVAAGVVPASLYPHHKDDPRWRLGHWATGFNTLICGSSVDRLSPNGCGDASRLAESIHQSRSRICDAPVPGFCSPGQLE